MTHMWVTEETVKETWLMRLQSVAVEQSLLRGLWEERSVFSDQPISLANIHYVDITIGFLLS